VLTFEVKITGDEFEMRRRDVRLLPSLELAEATAHPSPDSVRMIPCRAFQEE
jgi:hypothetical protein